MATRNSIILTIGHEYLTANIEEDEWKYSKALKDAGKEFVPIKRPNGHNYDKLDIRFECGQVSVLVETKANFDNDLEGAKAQLQAYVKYEKDLTGNKVVAILANTDDDRIMVWRGPISDATLMECETKLRTFGEYADFYTSKVNDKEQVMRNTYALNELLHGEGIPEKLRSQFVGTCLLALKNGVKYEDRSTREIITSMRGVLKDLLHGDVLRGEKLAIIERKVLEDQSVRVLPSESFRLVLKTIEDDILPFINDKSTAGQDLLNLFFITFNKYVGKADKNQAFTPDHITDFMAKVCDVNRNSRVLDATCGSGSFLVRAMTQAMDDCATEAEQEEVKKSHIYGIEWDDNAFGLATTNMLIHGDGNTNIKQGSVFDNGKWIEDQHIDVVLMNPPYNATKTQCQPSYAKAWASKVKEDPSKGFHFVKFVADHVKTGKMAVLLPMQCAIGTGKEIQKFKKAMLEEHTLDAVFTLPSDVFHPGASVSACCMVFTLGKRHDPKRSTFFGYFKEDGFVKRKNLGRVERIDADGKGLWAGIEEQWLDLYRGRKEVDGLSAVHCVTADDEWLAEAYMKTDYSKLTEQDFQQTINEYLAYLVRTGEVHEQ
ncbi:MAG: N-6 DNA methylase [Aeriscardovia sp.]|nr:N-6 DNA methylase [Aeriscardovia sp.]